MLEIYENMRAGTGFLVNDNKVLVATFRDRADAEFFVRAKESAATYPKWEDWTAEYTGIDMDDLVAAMNATFVGHRYREPLELSHLTETDPEPDIILGE